MARTDPRRVLLIQDRRFGDVALSTALLPDIAAAWPEAAIDFLVGAPAAPMLRHHPLIAEIIVLDRSRVIGMWRDIRRRRYDVVIDVQSNARTAAITRASGAPVRIGWEVRGYARAYTKRVPRQENDGEYVVRDRQRLLHAAGIRTAETRPRLYVTAGERAEGERVLAALEPSSASEPRVGLQLATAEPAKNWPIAHFVTLSQDLAAARLRPVVFCGPGEEAWLAEFRRLGGAGLVAPQHGLRAYMALLANCAVFVSGDTGPAHMATALGVPRVTLYGPTDPRGWDPGPPASAALRNEAVSCAGCDVRRCVRDGACMKGVSPARVLEAAMRLLHGRH